MQDDDPANDNGMTDYGPVKVHKWRRYAMIIVTESRYGLPRSKRVWTL